MHQHLLPGIAVVQFALTLLTLFAMLLAVCDPVMGDNGKLYVPAESADVYRNDVVSLASILTPNEFEAAKLTGLQIVTEADALRACRRLQEMGPHTVVSAQSGVQSSLLSARSQLLISSFLMLS